VLATCQATFAVEFSPGWNEVTSLVGKRDPRESSLDSFIALNILGSCPLIRQTKDMHFLWNKAASVSKKTFKTKMIPRMKNRTGTNACFKNRSNELIHLKKRSTLLLYIAVDRFFCTLLLDWFLKHALSLDRFFIERIGNELSTHVLLWLYYKSSATSTYLLSNFSW